MGEEKEPLQNLSEILFKPKRNYVETSLISNNGCPLPPVDQEGGINGFCKNWYRPITKLYWAWMGGNVLDIDQALARICHSKGKRSREGLFDTVEDYGPGNWVYEFSYIGQERIMRAKDCLKRNDLVRASHNYRMASRYFGIAAHPNLKGDVLAYEAAVLSRNAYRLMFDNEKEYAHYEDISFEVHGEKINAHVHSPDNKKLHPVVILLPTYLQSSTDFFRFFYDYLRVAGIALIIVDMPGIGTSAKLKLDVTSSDILVSLCDHIKNRMPYLDHTAIGLLGLTIGGTLATRFAILNPGVIKALCLVDPAIDEFFTNQKELNALPLCERSSLANRMDLNAALWDTIVPQLQAMSLKKQGLVSVTPKSDLPMMCCFLDSEKQPKNDVKLVCKTFKNSLLVDYPKADFANGFKFIFKDVSQYFIEKLTG